MAKWVQYTNEQRVASNKYTSIKSRVKKKPGYDLEDYWSREDFIDWYTSAEKKCCYCGSTDKDIEAFYRKTISKRNGTRGKTLEIERINDAPYSRDNCKLSCYWCNNAKSDVFTYEEFKIIGKAIGAVIRNSNTETKI
jgi:5-methylcytosine-specific restriction endonuclease McrA